MNVFSKIFKKSRKANVSEESVEGTMQSEATDLPRQEQEKDIAPIEQVGINLIEPEIDKNLTESTPLETKSAFIEPKPHPNKEKVDELNGMVNEVVRLAATPFKEFSEFKYAKAELAVILGEVAVVDKIQRVLPQVMQAEEFSRLAALFKIVEDKVKVLMPIVNEIASEQIKLEGEILKYTELTNEFAAKYKLSHDWEGKKPKMIEIGKNLNQKREVYLKKEEEQVGRVKALYDDLAKCHAVFVSNKDYLTVTLNKQINILHTFPAD